MSSPDVQPHVTGTETGAWTLWTVLRRTHHAVPPEPTLPVLSEALDSIQKRVDAPFLYDHNGLARQQIDPTKVKCSLPQGKTYYKAILDRILSPAHLKSEVRIDEADKPFVWISTVK